MSCKSSLEEKDDLTTQETKDDTSLMYIHPEGDLLLQQINDSSWNVSFTNLEGHSFDSVLIASNDRWFFDSFRQKDEIAFLKIGLGGMSLSQSAVSVFEFGGYGVLAHLTEMPHIYNQPLVRSNQEVSIYGDLIRSKSLLSVNGVYLEDVYPPKDGTYMKVVGTVKREKWPIEYVSTDESPQGAVGADEESYRLVFVMPKISVPENEIYEGYPVNMDEGIAAIAWDFADSEAYILEGRESWTEEELEQKIKVSGHLIQGPQGSILKNWEILE